MSRAMIPLTFLASLALVPHQFPVLGRGIPMASSSGGSPGLLQTANLSVGQCFLSPALTSGSLSTTYGTAMRYVGGHRQYLTMMGNAHVIEYAEPTLVSCSTALASMNTATQLTDYGVPSTNGSDSWIGGGPAHTGEGGGLKWDDATNELYVGWFGSYSNVPSGINAFGAYTLAAGPSLACVGNWGVSTQGQTVVGTGILDVPTTFLATNPTLAGRLGLGFGGGLASIGANLSLGFSVLAIAPPSGNACAANTDTAISTYTVLSQYESNNPTGPNCTSFDNGVSGNGLGCAPTPAPTHPWAGQTAVSNFSTDIYAPYWTAPYLGHGYIPTAAPVGGWYHDSVKDGVVAAMWLPYGYLNSTVSANNGGSYPNWSMTLPTTCTLPGCADNIRAGDLLFVQTCTPGVDTNCVNGGQDNDFSFVVVDTVNTSTGVVTYHVRSYPDVSDLCQIGPSASCGHPVVGGQVFYGCIYIHGQPSCSRGQERLQIIDPAQYTQVLASTLTSDAVTYTEDIDLTTLVPVLGSGSVSQAFDFWASAAYQGQARPVAVIPDSTGQALIVVFRQVSGAPGHNLIAIIPVSHTP